MAPPSSQLLFSVAHIGAATHAVDRLQRILRSPSLRLQVMGSWCPLYEILLAEVTLW